MKKLKYIFKLVALTLIVSLTSSCAGSKYPSLEDGVYAEFVTNKGTMVAKLFLEKTPVTVSNFVALAEGNHPMVDSSYKGKPYYNGIIFHRVINKFMIQGGDPTGTGTGSPGYRFVDEFDDTLKHDKSGILSMANSGPGTNGSQFFITEVPTPHLNNKHSIFGELVLGLDIQDSISNVKVAAASKPVEDVVILELNIIRKGFDARKFDAAKTWNSELKLAEEKEAKRKEDARLKLEEKARIAKETFIKENENLKGDIKHLPTGLALIFIKKSKAAKPKSTESVLVNYSGYFEDGRLFDTSVKEVAEKNGKYNPNRQGGYNPFKMIYNETATLVPGFREAMLNMVPGDKTRVFVPSHLAYGSQGFGSIIPPDTNLVLDLEIMGIAK